MEVQYNYDKFYLTEILGEKKFVVPQFQRNVVWNDKKRKAFVDTLRQGNPFGSILVHKVFDLKDQKDKYFLIDGLQRISTIKDFHKNPYKYFGYEDIDKDLVLELLEYTFKKRGYNFDADNEAVKQLCDQIRHVIFDSLKNGVDEHGICFKVVQENNIDPDEDSFRLISKIIKKFNDGFDISNLFVPTIIYTGNSDKLPDIFYNLNTGGVTLSKYETFSALWDSKKFHIDDEDIINKIYYKYEQLRKNSDLDVDVSLEEISDKGITLFEYCYSLSEILRNEYKVILGTNRKSTDPMGFEMLSLICGLNVNKAEKLDEKLIKATPKFLVELKDVIVDTFEVMNDALSPWIKSYNGSNNTLDSTYMLYHMAISYLKHNYIISLNDYTIKSISDRKWNDNFKKYLPFHYFKDYISDFWKKNRQVTDLAKELNSVTSLEKYGNNISPYEWEDALLEFRDSQLNEIGTTISLKSKMFLHYLLKFKIEEDRSNTVYVNKKFNDEEIKIDYEHIIPQKRIQEQLRILRTCNMKNYPVSCVGNLCYLSMIDNRAKKEKTLYEYVENRPSYIHNDKYLNFIDYPSEDEIRFINYKAEEFDTMYRSFIINRTDCLIAKLKGYLNNIL